LYTVNKVALEQNSRDKTRSKIYDKELLTNEARWLRVETVWFAATNFVGFSKLRETVNDTSARQMDNTMRYTLNSYLREYRSVMKLPAAKGYGGHSKPSAVES
jgi:hypothetical protein